MRSKGKQISAYDAKTHFSQLLRDTASGHAYTIMRRGKPVAQMRPPDRGAVPCDFKELASAFRRFRKGLRGKFNVKSLVAEGRRR